MEILPQEKRSSLLEYLAVLKYRLPDWMIVEIALLDHLKQEATSGEIARLLNGLFNDYEGRILVCSEREVLMLIEWGQKNNPGSLAKQIRGHLPEDTCDVTINPPTKEGLVKMQMRLAPGITESDNPLYQARLGRKGNIILVADDDMYMRLLAKKGLEGVGQVIEAGNGQEVVDHYRGHNPDIVFLDIHMPGRTGHEILHDLKTIDKKAFVVMVSADSSLENVQGTLNHGAKGFLAKPFTRQKLVENAEKCPTVY